jgi:NADH-quinone oxidoreductase subunit F
MDLDIIASVQENIIGNCLCVLGDSMAMPVGAMVRRWRGEFEEAIARGRESAPAPLDVEPALATPVAVGA